MDSYFEAYSDSGMIRRIRAMKSTAFKHKIVSFIKSILPSFGLCENMAEAVKQTLAVIALFFFATYLLGYAVLSFWGTPEMTENWICIPARALLYLFAR
jgi:hypothetical protein